MSTLLTVPGDEDGRSRPGARPASATAPNPEGLLRCCTSEISELVPLVAGLDLSGKALTIDALHTQRTTAQHRMSDKGADYLMTIKGNQPTQLATAQQMLSGPAVVFVEYTEHDRGHGRTEQRILRTAPITVDSAIEFPHAAQVFRVIRYVVRPRRATPHQEVAFRLAGWTDLKIVCRHFSHGIRWCVDLITKPVKPDKDQT